MVGNLYDILREEVVLPGSRRVLNHSNNSLIELAVLGVKEDSFMPHLILLASSNKLGNHNLLAVCANMIHEAMRLEFCV